MLLIAAAWGVWTHRLGVIDLDDAASNEVMFARRPLVEVVTEVPWSDQGSLAFVALHFWRRLGEDPATLKSLNLVLLTAALLVFHGTARRLCPPPRVALGAIALAVLSPASLWLARNGRMYSLQLLLWTLTLHFMVRWSESRRPIHLAGIVAASVLAAYNHFVGFVSAATVVLWLGVEAFAESRLAPPEERATALRRLLRPPAAAALAMAVLAQPAAMRLLAVLQAPPPVVTGQALPGGLGYLAAVSWFWFMNAGWGRLEAHAHAARAAYLGVAYLLFVVGLAKGSARMRRLVVVTVLLPVVLIGLGAGRMDFRDRHLLYLLPLVWLAIANAALGRETGEGVAVPRPIARVFVALLIVFGLASGWLLRGKLPERYVEWTKLVRGLLQLHRPGTAVYMAPGPFTGTPELIVSRIAPASGIVIRPLSEETRLEFLAGASERRDFMFLRQEGTPSNPEQDWRARHLEGLGYRRLVLATTGADAQVFTAGEWPPFSSLTRLPSAATPEAVAWARRQAKDPAPPGRTAGMLGRAYVARVAPDGTARTSTFFMSQGEESGYWRLGPDDGDRVEEVRMPAEGGEREALLARATGSSLLLIVLPAVEVGKGLELACSGWPASPGPAKPGAVSAEVFVEDGEAMRATCPLGRWDATVAATPRTSGGRADVTIALSAVGLEAADVAFRLQPLRREPTPPGAEGRAPGPIAMTPARTLKDEIGRLRVSRIGASGFGLVAGRFETAPRTAAVMHESPDATGAGGLGARWQLGDLPWDAVGVTLQKSGGVPRWGLWAHPKEQTILVVEADDVTLGHEIEGFYGLTDVAVDRSGTEVREPVRFCVLLDGRPLLAREVPRASGWTPFSAATPPGGRGRLRVEVSAARDSWAHFVFDLWPR